MLHTKALGLAVSEKKIFHLENLFFSLCDLVMQLDNFKAGHIRIILAKFGQNPASTLGGDVLLKQLF